MEFEFSFGGCKAADFCDERVLALFDLVGSRRGEEQLEWPRGEAKTLAVGNDNCPVGN